MTLSPDLEQKNIMDSLKKIVKQKKITYQDISKSTEIPESTLKKIFSGRDCSLGVILKICHAINIELSDIIRESQIDYHKDAFYFNEEQENYLCDNLDAYWVILQVYRKRGIKKIRKDYNREPFRLDGIIRELERLKLIERHPGDILKLQFSGVLRISDGSKLHDVIVEKISALFITALNKIDDIQDNKLHQMGSVKMTPATLRHFISSIRTKFMEIETVYRRERAYYQDSELVDVTYLLGIANYNTADVILD